MRSSGLHLILGAQLIGRISDAEKDLKIPILRKETRGYLRCAFRELVS